MKIKRYEQIIVKYDLRTTHHFSLTIIDQDKTEHNIYIPSIPYYTIQEIYDTVLYALWLNRYSAKIISIDEFGRPLYDIVFIDTSEQNPIAKQLYYTVD